MKKIFLTIISFFAFSAMGTAQDFEKNIFGVRGGINLSSISSNVNNDDVAHSNIKSVAGGLNFGVSYQRLLGTSTPLYLETGVYLSDKDFEHYLHAEGVSHYPPGSDVYIPYEHNDNYKTRLVYLQVPVLLNYHFAVSDGIIIQPFAGIYTACGIGGKTKSVHVFNDGGNGYSMKNADSFRDEMFKKIDFGLKIGIGATYHNIYIGLGYEHGLANINKEYLNGFITALEEYNKVKTRNFSITLGYNFSHSKKLKNDFNRIYPLDK
jgi:hypothetical protein